MKKKIKIFLVVFAAAIALSWYDPILDLFTRATTATLDVANDWLVFHDVTDGKKKKCHATDIALGDGFGNTVTQSGGDTLLNSALNYGHFHRVGDIVTFTVRVEIALVNTGAANTVYFDPPIASNFTTASTDVIGTASMDSQGLSSANTAHQRCLLFASDSDDKIGISFDPVASLSYPENRMYISASGSYIIQ